MKRVIRKIGFYSEKLPRSTLSFLEEFIQQDLRLQVHQCSDQYPKGQSLVLIPLA